MGHAKGQKPARFNEDVDTKSQHSIAARDYFKGSSSSKHMKVNLRSINNPAERD